MPTYVNSKIYHANGPDIKIIDQSVIEENSGWLRDELNRLWAAIGGSTPEVQPTALTITKGTSPSSIADGSTGTITFTTNAPATITVTTTSGTGWTAQLTSNANVTSHTIKVTNTSGGSAGTIAANAIKVTAIPTDTSAYTSITTPTGVNNNAITLSAPATAYYTITWNNNGGTTNASGGSTSVQQGQSVTLPTSNPQRKYTITWNPNSGSGASGGTTSVTYSFKGWYTATSGGTQVTASTVPTGNVIYYAQWNEQSPTSITIPTTPPTRSGYTFKGWYTATSGGTQVTSGTRTITSNTTFYAQWEAVQATYYWYSGQIQPQNMSSNPTVDDTNFTANKWHTLGTATTIAKTITGGTSGNDWYVAVPTSINLKPTATDLSTLNTSWDNLGTITISGISYTVWRTNSTGSRSAVYMAQ